MSAIGTGGGRGFSAGAAEGEAEDVDCSDDEDEGDVEGGGGGVPVAPGMVFGEVAGDGGRGWRWRWSQGRVTGVGAEDVEDGGAGAACGGVVMNWTISSLRRCQAVMVSRYATKGLRFPSPWSPLWLPCSSCFSSSSNTRTAYSPSRPKNSSSHLAMARTDSRSCPSTATTAPRVVAHAGFVVSAGGARGGEIFASTLILLIYGIVMTIASTLRVCECEADADGVDREEDELLVEWLAVCNGGSVRERS